MAGDRQNYIRAFDGLRGLAVTPVVLLHVGVEVLPNDGMLRELTRGWYGVDLFFVLSGFLITQILLGQLESGGTIDVRRFYLRRVLRLTPAYLSMLTAVLIGAAVLDPRQLREVPRVLPSILTGTYNYQIARGGSHFDVLVVIWSLCVEEQFYLLWPWVLRWMDLRNGLRLCLGAIAALSAYRTALYAVLNWGHLRHPSGLSAMWIYFATDTRIEVILIGCAAALSLQDPRTMGFWRRMRQRRWFAWSALAAAAVCIIFVTGGAPSAASWRSATFGYTLAGAATAMLVTAVFLQPESSVARLLSREPLVSLGTISYGVYLFHLPISRLVLNLCSRLAWMRSTWVLSSPLSRYAAASIVVMSLTWAAASLHYHYVERRVARMRPQTAQPRPFAHALGLADHDRLRESSFPAKAL